VQRKKAIVTGASSGIGVQFAELLAAANYDLVLIARSGAKLQTVADRLAARYGVTAHSLAKDLSLPGSAQEVFDRVGDVEVLVNNAGFATNGRFAENDMGEELNQLQLNVATLIQLTHLFVAPMLQRSHGKILNVASTAAFVPGPLMAVYYASKAFVLAFSQAISEEMQGTGVTVTCLCPGPTVTDFQRRANMQGVRLFSVGAADAALVAKAGYDGMMRGKRLVIPGVRNRVAATVGRFSPLWLSSKVAKKLNERS